MFSRLLERVLIVTLATFIALAVGEAVLRLAWHNPYRRESPDDLVALKKHHANTDRSFSRALLNGSDERIRLRTDGRSYILPSFQHDDPEATVVFLGGSTTECFAVREDLRFPALVSTLFSEQGLEVNTLNISRSGANLHDCLNVLLNHAINDHPDIAVLMEASNDAGYLRHDGNYLRSMGRTASMKDLAKWAVQIASARSHVIGLVRKSASSHLLRPADPARDWRQTATPVDSARAEMYRRRLRVFVHMCRDFGIVPVLMTQPFSRQTTSLTPAWLDATAQDQFNEIVREVGRAEGAPVIDLVRYLQEEIPGWNEPNRIFYDAIHVTDNGSRVYAGYIADRLRPLILERRPAYPADGK
jgi:lysophospholipase L1-like esterase